MDYWASNQARGLCRCGKERMLGKMDCSECSQSKKNWHDRNREKGLCRCGRSAPEEGKKSCSACLQYNKKRGLNNRKSGLCHCGRPCIAGLKRCASCRENAKTQVKKLHLEIIKAYGGKCQCPGGCAVVDPEFLGIDHVNDDGHIHRKTVGGAGWVSGGGGNRIYRDLKKRGFPKEDYILCCYNCNMARAFYGVCPHVERKLLLS